GAKGKINDNTDDREKDGHQQIGNGLGSRARIINDTQANCDNNKRVDDFDDPLPGHRTELPQRCGKISRQTGTIFFSIYTPLALPRIFSTITSLVLPAI